MVAPIAAIKNASQDAAVSAKAIGKAFDGNRLFRTPKTIVVLPNRTRNASAPTILSIMEITLFQYKRGPEPSCGPVGTRCGGRRCPAEIPASNSYNDLHPSAGC